MMKELVFKNRSIRRFRENESIPIETLRELVDLGRLSASGSNMQPLKYCLVNTPGKNNAVFPALTWAGFLKDWKGPAEGERPGAYIIICNDTGIKASPGIDHGIAAQSILLGAAEKGIGGCMIGNVAKAQVSMALQIPEHLEIVLVIALGIPDETVILEEVGPDKNTEYYRDKNDVHHVPKRSLDEVIII